MLPGTKVTIKAGAREPWGWQHYPEVDGEHGVVDVPHGTEGIVVDSDEFTVTIDFVRERTLYRVRVEDHYAHAAPVMRRTR